MTNSSNLSSLPTSVRCLLQPDRNIQRVYLTRIPTQLPRPGSDEHLIHVKCVSPCKDELTWAATDGDYMDKYRVDVPCFDVSGVVVSAPPESRFPSGTEVFSHTEGSTTGNAREYTVADGSTLAHKPRGLSWEEAASVPVSALTAYQALFVHGGLEWKAEGARTANERKRLLVTAAAGGVGVWALQLASIAGVGEVIAVNGTGNVEFVKSLGATSVVDYHKQSLGDWISSGKAPEVDLVLDMVGGQSLTDAWRMVKEGGKVISVISRDPETLKPTTGVAQGITSKFFILESNGDQLQEIAGLLGSGKGKPIIDSVWKFEEYQKAFAKLEDGHARGKIIIRVQD